MSGVSKLATGAVSEEARRMLKLMGKSSKIAIKLQAVISAQEHGIKKVAEIFGTTRPSVMRWIKCVRNGSFDKLFVAQGRERKTKLSESQLHEIRALIEPRNRMTCKEIKIFVMEEYNVLISVATAHRIVKSLGFFYITPRPRHYKADEDKQEEFKKN